MDNLLLPATPVTPEVRWLPAKGQLELRGESYPENVLSFYAPILDQIRDVLDSALPASLDVTMNITYFNSASAKAFHRLFRMLNLAAERGCSVRVLWHYDEEDDLARDLGSDIREDFPALRVEDLPLTAA